MQKITSIDELKAAIALLEIKQVRELELLKEQTHNVLENLRPVNLIKNTFSELSTAPDLKEGLLNTTMSLAAGYLSKKIVVGATHNPLKQVLGAFLQMGVSSLVAKNADGIKSKVSYLIDNFFRKKDAAAE